MSKFNNRFRAALPPAFLVVLFLGTSLYGLDFGVHWDETRAKFDSVKKSVDTGLFLQSNNEPTGFSYNYGGVNYLLTWAGMAPEVARFLVDSPRTREALADIINPIVYSPKIRLRVRAIYLFLSSLSILWLYCLCLVTDRSRTEAFLAAAILGLSWEFGYHSRWVAPDVIMAQFALLSLLCLAIGLKKRSLGWFYCSAIVVGLAAGTKYPGALLLPPVVSGAVIALWRERPSVLYSLKHGFALSATAGLAFVLTTPGAVLDPFHFFMQLEEQKQIYGSGWFGHTVRPGLDHFTQTLKYFALQGFSHYWSISIVFAALCAVGLLVLLKHFRLTTVLIATFCVLYLVFFSAQAALIVRNMIVLVPFLAMAAARGVTAVAQRLGKAAPIFHGLIGLMLTVNLGWAVYTAGQIGNRTDLDYFLRKFEDHARSSTKETFFVSSELLTDLNRLPDPLPGNITGEVNAPYTKAAFLQTEGADIFWADWPANRWNTYDNAFGALEVNLEAYPTFVGNERILVVARERLGRLPVSVEHLATPKLTVSKTEVVAGRDSYVFKVKDVGKSNLILRFSLEGVLQPEFVQAVDEKGEALISIPASVRKGNYRFLAYRKDVEAIWHNVDVNVLVK
jgi:hypothetical protein